MAKKIIVDLDKEEKAELIALTQKVAQALEKSNEQTICYWLMLENLILKLPNFYIQAG